MDFGLQRESPLAKFYANLKYKKDAPRLQEKMCKYRPYHGEVSIRKDFYGGHVCDIVQIWTGYLWSVFDVKAFLCGFA